MSAADHETALRNAQNVLDELEQESNRYGPWWAASEALAEDVVALVGLLRQTEQERDAAQREADHQLGEKLAAQSTLKAITDSLDLPLASLGNGWTEATMKILARIEQIVDKGNRGFDERDAAVEELERVRVQGETPALADVLARAERAEQEVERLKRGNQERENQERETANAVVVEEGRDSLPDLDELGPILCEVLDEDEAMSAFQVLVANGYRIVKASKGRDDVATYNSFLAADQAASIAHDFIYGLNGVTQEQASAAIWTIHETLRPFIVLDGDDVAGNLEGDPGRETPQSGVEEEVSERGSATVEADSAQSEQRAPNPVKPRSLTFPYPKGADEMKAAANPDQARPSDSLFFRDDELVKYVETVYGQKMGLHCRGLLRDDPSSDSRFANSIRRSLTRELDQAIRNGHFREWFA